MVDPVNTTATGAPSPTPSPQAGKPDGASFAAMLDDPGSNQASTSAANAQPPAGGCGCCGGRPATASSHLKRRPSATPAATAATPAATTAAQNVSTIADRALLAYLRNLVTDDREQPKPGI